MTSHLDLLETQLLKLGQQERLLEHRIQELLTVVREVSRSGRFDEADAAWELRERLRTTLAGVQTEIMRIERALYSARLRRQ